MQYVTGVGPRRAELFGKLGVRTVGDLIQFFPHRHERHERTTIADLQPDTIATIVGRVTSFRPRRHHRGPSVIATVTDNTERCSVTWFNAPYVLDRIRPGAIVRLTGKVRDYDGLPQFVNPQVQMLGPDAAPIAADEASSLEPVYPATKELPAGAIRRIINAALPRALPLVREVFPAAYRLARKLPPRAVSIERMHRPTKPADVQRARRRLAYDELLFMQLAVQLARRRRNQTARAEPLRCTPRIDARIRRRLPFTLTAAQDGAIRDIVADLARDRPMHRLLQGDVGSGKTVVAVYAALVAMGNRRQAAVLAPTELLAEQHHRNITRFLEGSRVRCALWIGGGTKRRRTELRNAAAAGTVDLVVGTQAVLEQDIDFKRLGLVIVDEQHRFGVRQRATLRGKGLDPHYLVMTATPIPRSLAMTVFGDLDVSVIDELPPGRAPIQTKLVRPPEFGHTWRFLRSRIECGEQAYVVYPLVEESEKTQLRAATTEARRLAEQELAGLRVGLLHGRMKPAEKEAVMQAFAQHETDVLVATTVIEVGIDVPNATVMMIQHAERYGLAQLHQLRGRIGRGGQPGHCYLMTDSLAGEEHRRLTVLTQTTDGFRIAEEDLRLRGPGELLGTRQHGLPTFRVADLLRDLELVRMARRDAAEIIRADPRLQRSEWRTAREYLLTHYRDRMRFLDAG